MHSEYYSTLGRRMKRYKGLLILLFVSILSLQAQNDVKFVVDVPQKVVKGGQFHLTFILENGSTDKIEMSEQIEGFQVLYGPATSRSSSVSIINGKRSSSSSTSFSYTLRATDEGTYSMPIATVVVDGRSYKSNAAKVTVLPPDKNAAEPQGGRPAETTTTTSTANNISSDDVFVRPIFSKTKVNEQEAVVVTFRLYSVLNIRAFVDAKFPEFDGFMMEEFEFPANRQIDLENYKGRNYYTLDVKKTLLFPQRSGKITIPSGSVTLVLNVPTGQKVQGFFGVQEVSADVEKTLRTSPVIVDVSKLPDGKPLGFSGAVGSFKLNPSISATKVNANDAITLKLQITGTGNMKLIKNPEVKMPKDFEAYDPKVANNFSITANGLSGTRTIEYLFIPRYPGKFTIPEIEFSYFNTSTRKYEILKTEAYEIEVDKDPNAGNAQSTTSYVSQQEVKVDQDIRYLKTGDMALKNYGEYFSGSLANYLWYIIPTLLFAISVIMYRKQIKANADIARMKTKKANKVASKRLKQANKYLKNHEKDKFYEESLRAIWGYLSDKLTIPVADLNRENIDAELRTYGVGDDLISRFISVLDTCEFARYAPSESDKAMDKLYAEMVTTIGEMESVIKIK